MGARGWFCAVLTAAAIAASSLPAWADRFVTMGQVGLWTVVAQFEDSGAFEDCAIMAASMTPHISIAAISEGYVVRLSEQNWSLPDAVGYTVETRIGVLTWNGDAEVTRNVSGVPNGVTMLFGYTTGFGNAFRAGSLMTMTFSNGTQWSFPLSQSDRAMSMLGSCVQANLRRSNPFAGSESTQTNPFQ